MKNIFCNFLSLKLKIGVFFFFILFSLVLNANNIQIKEAAKVVSVSGGYATIEVRLTWNNSWRDTENWDAAYLFLKYRTSGGNWSNVAIQASGNVISSPYAYMTATPKWNTAPGVFIYRDDLGSGTADVTCRLLWATGYSKDQFDQGKVEVLAQAIEMVFIPSGGYILGDSLSANCFAETTGKPIKITTEASNVALGYKQEGGVYENVTVAGSYPKGYQGFYTMKYEVTQEQYVSFLNTLTLAQQNALHPNSGSWKEGNYIFGNPQEVTNRNGIIMAYHVDPSLPMVFANNYNKGDEYNSLGDGQTLACNYLSVYDLLAYSSWAGLRPMSEMEYEKACRPPLSFPLVKAGYAWNGLPGTTQRAMGVSAGGAESEKVSSGNVNFRKGIDGPLRSGVFATSGTGQEAAGSTYWGVMEMSGNVQELCRNVNDWYFYSNYHGEGVYNPGIWSTHMPYYGLRGGGFASNSEQLQVSDRSNRGYFSERSVVYRDSTVGFRGVRTMELGDIDINPGAISALTTICPNISVKIENRESAKVLGMNNVPIRYEWYLNSVLLEGEHADTLRYSNWSPGAYYNFVRKAICAIGEKMTNTVRIYVTSPVLTAGTIKGGTRCAPGMFTVENQQSATMECNYPITYSWYIDDVLVADSVREVLAKRWDIGTYRVVRKANAYGMSKDAATTVNVTKLNLNPGQIYGGQVTATVEKTVTSVKDATVACGGFIYHWLIDSVLVADAHDPELKHVFDTAGFYQVIRRVIADDSTIMDVMDTVIVNDKSAICGRADSIVIDDQENKYTILPMADDRCWMTQNMRFRNVAHQHAGLGNAVGYDGDNIKYHEGKQANDEVYGLHYDWNAAMQKATYEKAQGICPAGWYIPTDEEWRTLEIAYGMNVSQANETGWRGSNQGTQFKVGGTSKFKILLSGYNGTAYFNSAGYYWTSTQTGGSAYVRHFTGDPKIYRYADSKGYLWSVRCIRSKCLGGQKPRDLQPGAIKGGVAGVNFPYTVKTLKTATVSCGGIEYSWYVNDTLVEGKGASLTYVFTRQGVYNIVRRALADDNVYADTSAIVKVFPACGEKNYVLDDQANRYDIKEMGDARCWMTQNMRRRDISHIHTGGSVVGFDGDNINAHKGVQSNDTTHGLHYIWSVAMQGSADPKAQGICPAGWYVPTDEEWRTLEMAYGMTEGQANALDAWRGYDEGAQFKPGGRSGFNLTLSGYAGNSNVGTYGYYWTSTTYSGNGGYAYFRHLYTGYPTIYRYWSDKNNYMPVRCIRSMCYEAAPKDIDAGIIIGGSIGVNYPITIQGKKSATVSCGGLEYSWYIGDSIVSGADGASLTYTFDRAGVYYVKRVATADNGDFADVKVKVVVYAPCGALEYVHDAQANKYSIKEMADGRCWMTQNMRRRDISHIHAGQSAIGFDGDNIKLHEGEQVNDTIHGLHYTWPVAMQSSNKEKAQGICPSGWYIPTDGEWRTLEMAYGMTAAQADGLDAWRGYNEGAQFKPGGSSGFNLTLSGYAGNSNVTTYGYYWTSTTYAGNGGYAYFRHLYTGYPTIYRYWDNKNNYMPIRCIRSRCEDGEEPDTVYAGAIKGGVAAANYPFNVQGTESASVNCGGVYYSWYINDTLINGEVGESLTHTFGENGTYKIVRRATADNGIYADTTVRVFTYAPCMGTTSVFDDQGYEYAVKAMADNRCWMTQNMRRTDISHIHAGGSVIGFDGDNVNAHKGEQANDKVHGVHYTWPVAMQGSTDQKAQGICPSGWYVPTDEEWRTLEMAYGMTAGQADGLDVWRGYNEGALFKPGGSSGFNLTLSGYAGNSNVTTYGYYWTSTTYAGNGGYAYYRHLYAGYPTVYRYWLDKNNYMPVRCIRSMCFDENQRITSPGVIQGGSAGVNFPFTIKGIKTATANCGGLTYSWFIDGDSVSGELASSLTHTFDRYGTYQVTRRVTADNGVYADTTATVVIYSPCLGNTSVFDDQGHKYPIKEMADFRCWMTQNMRRTDISHIHAGSSVIGFDGDNVNAHKGQQANDTIHGIHYTWPVAMQGSTDQKAQGICPAGWYVPTDEEWRTLEMAYGMTAAQADGLDVWRGYNEGAQFKPGGSSGFNLTLSGYAGNSNVSTYGYYWTSTTYASNGGYAYYRHLYDGYTTIYRYWLDKNNYMPVRCIRSTCYGGATEITSPGAIKGGATGVNFPITIKSTATAKVNCGGVFYSWYIDDAPTPLSGEVGASLTYTFGQVGKYKITRRATSDAGSFADTTATVVIYSPCSGQNSVFDAQGYKYAIKEMADARCWMTQNMRRTDVPHIHAGGSVVGFDGDNIKVHEGILANDTIHGIHYTWPVAMQDATGEKAQGICPAGWYVATDEEWRTLEMAYGMTAGQADGLDVWRGYNEGAQFKPGGGSGFNLTLSGYAGNSNVGTYGYCWTSTTYSGNGGYAYFRHLYDGYSTIYRYWLDKNNYMPVRCIRAMCYDDQARITSAGTITGGITSVNYPIKIKSAATATSTCGGLKYSWYVDGTLLPGEVGATLTWTPGYVNTYEIKRRATVDDDNDNYLEATTEVIVYSPCVGKTVVHDNQGHPYNIKEMADTRCWMTQNIRRTDVPHQHAGLNAAVDVDGSNLYYHEGVWKNDTLYGCHYNWSVAMQGMTAEKSQGICPPGWYIPTDAEWKNLEMAYGMTAGQANVTDWRGYDQGTLLKAGGSAGFNVTFPGYNATSSFGTAGYYWTSNQDGGNAWVRYFTADPRIYRYTDSKGYLWSVRCIRSQCYQGDVISITSPGKIKGGTVGTNYPITIKGTEDATVSCGGLEYSWYINNAATALSNEVGASLTYTFNQAGKYRITRRATADDGNTLSVSDTVVVYSPCEGQTSVFDDQGHEYKIKEMADFRCWMTQNIRRTDIPHFHSGNNNGPGFDGDNINIHKGPQPNDELYGCHYKWLDATQGKSTEKAQGICPPGWYIPTDKEWIALEKAYGMTDGQADALDAWRGYDEGAELKIGGTGGLDLTLSGFAGGSNFTTYGYYWTSTTYAGNGGYAYFRHLYSGYSTIYRYWSDKNSFYPVRCIRSMCYEDSPQITSAGTIEGGIGGINYPFTVKNTATATSTCAGLKYSWYVDGVLVPNEVGATLTYTPTAVKVYRIKRRVSVDSDANVYSDAEADVKVYSPCVGKTVVHDNQGHPYNIKEMADTRCWMTQNIRRTDVPHQHAGLNAAVDVDGSNLYYHEGVRENDILYGCHYNWSVAMQGMTAEKSQGICPPGWYIPTDAEWKNLEMAYGMTAGQANVTDWRGYDQGTLLKAGGSAGFNVTFPGYNATSYFGTTGYYWTSNQDGGNAWVRHFTADPRIYRYADSKGYLWSVRCIRSQCYQGDVISITSPGKIKGGIAGKNYPITIKGMEDATVSCGGLEYSWYINNAATALSNEVGASLTYTFNQTGKYRITRRATADDGNTLSVSDTVVVYSPCVGETFVYDDQGNKYNIKDMADARCWMTQNIRRTDVSHIHANGSVIGYDGDNINGHKGEQANDKVHGIHYTWSVAMKNAVDEKSQGLCPAGWYIPSDKEWIALEKAYGMTDGQADALDAWRGYDEGAELKIGGTAGLDLTLSGYAGTSNFGSYGYYWTSTPYAGNSGYAYYRLLYGPYNTVYRYWLDKNNYLPVRCIRSMCYEQTGNITSAGSITGGKAGVNYPFVIKDNTGAKAVCGGIAYSWFINGGLVADEHGAYLEYTFTSPGTYSVVRVATADNGNYQEALTTVQVVAPCDGRTQVQDIQGNTYSIKEMADVRCWMTQNMRRTDIQHYHANSSAAPGVDGSSVHDGPQTNDAGYGCLYSWDVAMQGSRAERSQGICPIGWHIPSDLEWRELEMAYGMTVGQANAVDWRGYDEGTEFKQGGTSGLNLSLSGYNGTSGFTTYGYYWTSTEYAGNTGYAYYRHLYSAYATIYRSWPVKTDFNTVRCIKNE